MAKVTSKPLSLSDYDELYYPTPTNNFDGRANGSGVCYMILTVIRNGKEYQKKILIGSGRKKPDQISFPTK